MSSPAHLERRRDARQDRLQPVPDLAFHEHPAVARRRPEPGRRDELPRRHQGQPPEPEHGARPAHPADQAVRAGRPRHGRLAQYLAGSSTRPAPSRPSRTAGTPSPTRSARTSSSLPTSPALASSDSLVDTEPGEPVPSGPALRSAATRRATDTLGAWRSDGAARWLFIWPAVLVILFLSIFPLVASVALSVSKLAFHQGGVDLKLRRLLELPASCCSALEQSPLPRASSRRRTRSAGRSSSRTVALAAGRGPGPSGAATSGPFGLVLRLIGGHRPRRLRVAASSRRWLSDGGRPGALIVTLIFVFAGIALQLAARPRARDAGRPAAARGGGSSGSSS